VFAKFAVTVVAAVSRAFPRNSAVPPQPRRSPRLSAPLRNQMLMDPRVAHVSFAPWNPHHDPTNIFSTPTSSAPSSEARSRCTARSAPVSSSPCTRRRSTSSSERLVSRWSGKCHSRFTIGARWLASI